MRLLGLCLVVVFAMSAVMEASASGLNGVAGWGSDFRGQLGVGEATEIPFTMPVAAHGELGGTKATANGVYFSLALLSNGTVKSWGENERGELGNGTTTNTNLPGAVKNVSTATAISATANTALALLSNGTVMAWGDNSGGQLGDGTTTGPEKCEEERVACSTFPVEVKELTNVKAIAEGGTHSLALLENGTVMAWGENYDGQLGDGNQTSTDTPVAVKGLTGVVAIAAGEFTSMALLENGSVMAWGGNALGALGDGSTEGPEKCGPEACSTTPVEVKELTSVKAIAAGEYASNYALLTNGMVKSWGDNELGELGNGSTTNSDVPVSVSGLSGVTAIAGANDGALAVIEGGAVEDWGRNNAGQLGNGEVKGPQECLPPEGYCSKTPVSVSGLHKAVGVSGGAAEHLAYGPTLGLGKTPELEPEEMFGKENPGEPNQKRACAGDPVSCATGNLTESQSDLSVGGRGVPLVLTRTYNAQGAVTQSSPGLFGYGWSSSFGDHLTINSAAGTVTVVQANGSAVIFKSIGGPGELTAPQWAQAKLVLNGDGTYTYTLPTQETFHFDASGRLLSETDRSGNTTTMNRSAEGRLESVTDAAGRKLMLTYNTEGQVESVKDPMGHTVKYTYESGNLASVTLPGEASARWQYKYDSSHRLTTVTNGRGGKTTNEYDSSNRVISQKDPAERTTSFEYEPQHTTITNKATGSVTKEVFTDIQREHREIHLRRGGGPKERN
jgi:YD repeat-containing protein